MIRGAPARGPLLALLMLASAVLALPGSAQTPAAFPASEAAPEGYPLRMPQMPLHDPFIVADKASRTYVLYTSNIREMSGAAGVGIMAYKSRDLKHWSRPKPVFMVPPGLWAKDGAWAPEVHRWNGRWWLFTTLHNEASPIAGPARPNRSPYRRGTILAVSDSLDGPFVPVRNGEPIAPASRMTLDGTLHVDAKGRPWLVFAGEWLQQTDGTIEAMPLTRELAPAGPPQVLFTASSAPWVVGQKQPRDLVYVTDGPQLYRSKDGHLLMLWSSYGQGGYVQSIARSKSGEITGPWEQLDPLIHRDSGHGMLFTSFEGKLMMVLHRPFRNALGKLYEMRDEGDHLDILRQRIDLDGDPADIR